MAVRTSFTAGEVLAAADLTDTFGAKLNLAGGKVLQVVRATDATQRSTSSTSFVDASINVTITPQKSDSAILLIWSLRAQRSAHNEAFLLRITDNSNNAISGSQEAPMYVNSAIEFWSQQNLFGYSTPSTISATTYKGRFRVSNASTTGTIRNDLSTGQMYAIEVSA